MSGVRAWATVVAIAVSFPAAALPVNKLYWPVGTSNTRVCAYRDDGATKDWKCQSNTYTGHRGTDIAVGSGTTVLAAAPGLLTRRTDGCPVGYVGSPCGSGFGNHVVLWHTDATNTYYAHLGAGSGIAALNTNLGCGARVGGSGSSGSSSGPHLHFEVRLGGSQANPYGGSSDDPFSGPCAGPLSYWAQQGTGYATSCSVFATHPQSAGVCGCPAGTFDLFNCNDAKTARVRCESGKVETESCAHGCEVKPLGTSDVCKPPPPCPAGVGAAWACNAGNTGRQRCLNGKVENELCASGCESPGAAEASCRVAPVCPANLGRAWTCTGAASRTRCTDGKVETEACNDGCAQTAPAEAACQQAPLPGNACPTGTHAQWTCEPDGSARVRCQNGAVERAACGAGCTPAAPELDDACATPVPPGVSSVARKGDLTGGCGCATADASLLGALALLLAVRLRRPRVAPPLW